MPKVLHRVRRSAVTRTEVQDGHTLKAVRDVYFCDRFKDRIEYDGAITPKEARRLEKDREWALTAPRCKKCEKQFGVYQRNLLRG